MVPFKHGLLDTGSTNFFVTEKLVNQLKLKGTPIKYQISTLDNTKDKCSQLVKFDNTDPEQSFSLSDVMVVSDIPAKYPPMVLDLDSYPQFKGLCLPRPEPGKNADILIGMDNAYLLKPVQTKSSHVQKGLFAIQTVLGWTICGPVEGSIEHDAVVPHCVAIDQQIQILWDIETSDENQYLRSVEDNHVMSLWEDNIITFKEKVPSFPNNRVVAEKRLSYLRPKL